MLWCWWHTLTFPFFLPFPRGLAQEWKPIFWENSSSSKCAVYAPKLKIGKTDIKLWLRKKVFANALWQNTKHKESSVINMKIDQMITHRWKGKIREATCWPNGTTSRNQKVIWVDQMKWLPKKLFTLKPNHCSAETVYWCWMILKDR